MSEYNLEEEIDTLEYAYDNLDGIISLLKNLSSNGYNEIISQCSELLNEVDFILENKQQELDNFTKEQLEDARLEYYEREKEYRKMQGF